MDFAVRLPKIQSIFDRIMVVVDRLTKIVYFDLTATIVTAYGVVGLFMRETSKHHRISHEFISDRDRKFLNEF